MNTSLQKSQVLLFLVLTDLFDSRHKTATVGNPGTRTRSWMCPQQWNATSSHL